MEERRVSQYTEKMPTQGELRSQQASGKSAYLDRIEYTDEDIEHLDTQEKLKNDKTSKILGGLLVFLIAALLVFIGVYIAATGGEKAYPENPNQYVDASVKYYSCASVFAGLNVNVSIPDTEMPEGILDKYKPLYSVNPDLVGWLKIPNTSIDFGVYQSEDNDTYHRTDIYGNRDTRGLIYADYHAVLDKGKSGFLQNTVIYGHHLTSNEMIFAEVENYREVEFYKTSPVVEFGTLTEDLKWKVIACFQSTTKEEYDNNYVFYYVQPSMSEQCFSELLGEIKKRSFFVNEAAWENVDSSSKLLMLSTCSYEYYANGYEADSRTVLVCALIENGESSEIDVSGAYANPNPKLPQVWYDINNISNPYINDTKWYAYY